jgi:hypothetical protein
MRASQCAERTRPCVRSMVIEDMPESSVLDRGKWGKLRRCKKTGGHSHYGWYRTGNRRQHEPRSAAASWIGPNHRQEPVYRWGRRPLQWECPSADRLPRWLVRLGAGKTRARPGAIDANGPAGPPIWSPAGPRMESLESADHHLNRVFRSKFMLMLLIITFSTTSIDVYSRRTKSFG